MESPPAWVGGALCRTGLTGNGRSLAPTDGGPCRFYPAPGSYRDVQAIRGRLPVHAAIASWNNPMSGRYVGERFTRSAAEIARRAMEVSRVAGCCNRAVGRSTSLVALRAISVALRVNLFPPARADAPRHDLLPSRGSRSVMPTNESWTYQITQTSNQLLKAGCIDELCIKMGKVRPNQPMADGTSLQL